MRGSMPQHPKIIVHIALIVQLVRRPGRSDGLDDQLIFIYGARCLRKISLNAQVAVKILILRGYVRQ